jgi:DNA polymerase epsilon subunit 1
MWFQQLINNLDRDLQYAIRVEGKMDLDSVSNYDEVKNSIMEKVLIMIFVWLFFMYG